MITFSGCSAAPTVLFLGVDNGVDVARLPVWLGTGQAQDGTPGPLAGPGPIPPAQDTGFCTHGRRLALEQSLSRRFQRLYIPALQGIARRGGGDHTRLRLDAVWPGGFLARMEADHHHRWRPTDDHLLAAQGRVVGQGPLLVLHAPTGVDPHAPPSAHAQLAGQRAWTQVPPWAWNGPAPALFVWG